MVRYREWGEKESGSNNKPSQNPTNPASAGKGGVSSAGNKSTGYNTINNTEEE